MRNRKDPFFAVSYAWYSHFLPLGRVREGPELGKSLIPISLPYTLSAAPHNTV